MDEDKRRRRALEAGRELLENYKSKRSNKRLSKSLEEASDEESIPIEAENQSMDLRSVSNNESLLRDTLYSSVSMSEGEGDGDLEGLAGRVTELEEMLQGKEAVVEALHAEIDHLRADASSPTSSHSQNSNNQYKDIIGSYHAKLQEFQRAVNQRDTLIEDLTASLQQALASRDALLAKISILNSTQVDNTNAENVVDEKITALEVALSSQKELVSDLASQLEQAQENVKRLEIEKESQSTELSDYKNQIENLNKKIRANSVENDSSTSETHELQKQYEDQVEKIKKDMKVIIDKFTAETNANNIKHENEMRELNIKYEMELKKLREENQNLETRHSKEMSVLQSQLSNYKRTIESLKLDLVTGRESHMKEKELLTEQIKLHKLQLDEMTTKYVATASVLDSKESIERSLEQALNDAATLRTENESLKFKLDDLSSRYSAAQSLIENGQLHERNLSNRIFNLEKSLSRLSGISVAELDETAYQTLDGASLQYQIAMQMLEEKTEMEKELIQKVHDLEQLVSKTKNELESANLAKESCEKQIKDMKNTCDRLKSEMNSSLRDDQRFSADSLDCMRMQSAEFEQEILELKKTIEKRDEKTAEYIKKLEELTEANQKLEEESDKLKNGLATAYAQCAVFEEKLDQTLGFGESKLEDTTTWLNQTSCSNASSLDLEELLQKQSNYNKVLIKLESCRKQLEDYEREKSQLLLDVEEKARKNEELLESALQKDKQHHEEIQALKMEGAAKSQKFQQLLSSYEEGNASLKQLRIEMEEKHAKEMEELRTYFEQKCLQMEKQYSEEIFSQHSKKMSDNDSEIEELTEDLYVGGSTVDCLGGGGDAIGVLNKDKNDTPTSFHDEQQKNVSEEKISKIAAEYEEKLESLRKQLQEVKEKSGRTVLLKAVNQFCQTEQSSTGTQESCQELNELRADYNRQLEEQVGLARIDIINALQEQIEALITVESESDENWPTELLELRNKFTSNTKREIQALKERHVLEIKRLKEENNQIINNLQEEIKKIKAETHGSLQANLIKERDTLHKTCATLKGLVSQLIDYFVDCEEELNNTLISEVFKKQLIPRAENPVFENEQPKVKRVHFAPQSIEIASIVGSDSDLRDLVNSEKDVMKILKSDLDACLKRLKDDSAKILNESFSDTESWSTGIGDNPNDKHLETEKLLADFQEENEHLKVKIIELQQRLLIAENKKEVISEGYGEQDESVRCELEEDFSQLQDRAKFVVMNGSNDTSYLLQLIDELCRHADKSIDDMKREKEELQHEIEMADQQLRSTRKFQEEQAVERETERDEAAKQIQMLQEKLREREREKERDQRNTSGQTPLSPASSSAGSSPLRQVDESEIDVSVEDLTRQVRELEAKRTERDAELKEAVAKIYELRELIRDLEQQVQSRSEREEILSSQIEQLEEVIVAQTKNQQELVQELEVVKSGNENNQLSDHIGHLQEELRKHQLSSEQLTANSSTLRQLRLEIRELQSQLDRKTRELESMHVCSSNLSLSQPSEDVSIREQIDAVRCPTPDDPSSPPVLPLDHVLKLKDTLMKHFRAEDVTLKRLKDLEIQLSGLQRQNEELQAEQELLQQTTSEQLFQIETLRARLEQQKHNAPFAQRQATSRLESQLYEIKDRLEIAERALHDKDIESAETKDQLERVSRLLAEKETEIANIVQSEGDALQKLRNKLNIVEEEKLIMQAKLNTQEKNHPSNLPQLIDQMLADKNEEIDNLKEQLKQREKQLDIYLTLDEVQIRELLRQNEQKNSARTLSDILSINSECEDSSEAIREAPNYTRQNISNFKMPNSIIQSTMYQPKKDVVDFSQPITETPKVPRLELDHSQNSEAVISNIIEISKEMESIQTQQPYEKVPLARVSPTPDSNAAIQEEMIKSDEQNDYLCPRHGRVSNVTQTNAGEETMTEQRIQELEMHLHEIKDELSMKSAALEEREAELMEIQNSLEQLQENIESLNQDRLFYKLEYEKAKDNETKIQKDLIEVENELKKKNEELDDFKEMIHRCKRSESSLQEKLKEINNLREIISEKDITIETLQSRNAEMENENKGLYEYRQKFESYQQEIAECQSEIQRLSEGLNSRDQMIRRLEEIARRSSLSGGSSPSEKDQEIFHLQEYLKEKDKVIRQMSDDSKSLHRALETIQSKMKESGNVVELRRKLKDERKNNVELTEEIAKLRTEVEMLSSGRRIEEDNDIAEMVQRELNLSARLDQQLFKVIDSEPEDVLKKCGDLKQANKEIDELTRLKDDLEIEREMLKSQITEYENRIMQLKADAEEESTRISRLEEEFSRERHLVRSLQLQLQKEKNAAEENKTRDTELISLLRIKLDEALEVRDRLAIELRNREVISSMSNQNKEGVTANFEIELKKLTEQLEVEQRKYEEAQDTIKKLELEKERLQKQHDATEADIEKLTNNLDLADVVKDQMKADLRKAKEELKTKTRECDWQKSILKTMSDAENKRNQQKSSEHSELKNLRRELKNTQDVMMDFEADMKTLKEQLSEAAEREEQLTRCIESLTDKETDLTEQLSAAKVEDKKLREIIADQQNDLKFYLRREIDLAEELRRERTSTDKNNSPSKILQRVKDLNATIERLSQDKVHLYEKVSRIREENERYLEQIRFLEIQLSQKNKGQQNTANRNDAEERLQHFYGKYLRSESRRKALIYQKNYLLIIIAGYQRCEENTLTFLAQLTQTQRAITRRGQSRRTPCVRFRSAVLLIIGIQRMKWLILRWRTGRRVGANVVLGNMDRPAIAPSSRQRSAGTMGHSPPVRERTMTNGTSGFSHDPYFRRFTDIQHGLHLRVPETSTVILNQIEDDHGTN